MKLRFSILAATLLSLLIIATWSAEIPFGISTAQQKNKAMEVKIMTLDPGHFHAGLVQKEMYPDVSPRVHVYAPLGFDLYEHLKRIAGFNNRKDNPTRWEMEIHAGGDPLQRMLAEHPGNVVTMAGRNQGKIDRIKASVEGGLNVLVDKPWIINASDFPKLEATFKAAEAKKLIAYDIMTERYEISTILQRELSQMPDLFGTLEKGTPDNPAITKESVHHFFKFVSGAPLIRPAWFLMWSSKVKE